MRHRTPSSKRWLIRAAVVGLLSIRSFAADIKIVANPSVKADSISAVDLRSVFLAEKSSLNDGSHVEPVFQRGGAVHEIFLRDVLRESGDSLQRHYGALVFTGKASMPKSFNSDADVLAYVARTRGAIGYVSASANASGVKELIVSDGGHASRVLLTRVDPEYPDALRPLHIGGTVRLEVTVSPRGAVEEVTLVGGNPILGEAAIKAVKQWVYAAAPTQTTLQVSVPFAPQ
jgi:TonB family protein